MRESGGQFIVEFVLVVYFFVHSLIVPLLMMILFVLSGFYFFLRYMFLSVFGFGVGGSCSFVGGFYLSFHAVAVVALI